MRIPGLSRNSRNAVIHATRLVASSGLTRANRVQRIARPSLVPSLTQSCRFSLYLAKTCAMISAIMNIPFAGLRGLAVRVVCLGFATMVLSIAAPAQAQVVSFPDPNLEAAVRPHQPALA